MPIELSWQQPNRVIYERFYDVVTIEELTSTQIEFVRWVDEGNAPVHSIIDLSAVREFPKSINQVRRAVEVDFNSKSGRVMIVFGANSMLKFIAQVISQVLFKQAQITFCNSLDEAVGYLCQHDATVTIEGIGLNP